MESPFKADILKGKVGLITGGGSGIGFEISTQLGKHGASIAIMGRRKHVLQAAVSALQSLGIHGSYCNNKEKVNSSVFKNLFPPILWVEVALYKKTIPTFEYSWGKPVFKEADALHILSDMFLGN
ncbi:hypothetical protein PVK06_029385 [Gossypium arboreum]|uniref:2,4-dienoyl-CoA reductase [(3E)-enoyl-CoA-producing] n=1 Tax=Gossypium arboreum TaxID=29729 RepID=A0ABR0P6M2_GOSAR|nr:hypothetical protein PVK06_029385 [Gossypium arboreum]